MTMKRLLLILQVDHSRVTEWLSAHWGNDEFRAAFAPPGDGAGGAGRRYGVVGMGDQAAAQ